MNLSEQQKNNRQVAMWLLVGVGMLVIQILLGGITRLTESGLSITEWKPITGALPPLNEQAWQQEFEKYRHTDQFKYVHAYFGMKDFKFIFFWEWFHRFWARLMSVVFAVGFVYFLVKRKMSTHMIVPMLLLFFLGGIQGAIGWIMVKSGLVPEKYFVGHIELTTHFISALVLLSYTLWFALTLLPSFDGKLHDNKTKNMLLVLLCLFFIQLVYGGFMAGMKAASTAPTWPLINGHFFPSGTDSGSLAYRWFHDPLMVHFIHRNMAYLVFLFSIFFYIRTSAHRTHPLFGKIRFVFMLSVVMQVALGVSALIFSTRPGAFVYVGVMHQFTAMCLVIMLVSMLFLVRRQTTASGV